MVLLKSQTVLKPALYIVVSQSFNLSNNPIIVLQRLKQLSKHVTK